MNNIKREFDIILFDLDGTITDPGIGITNSVKYALKHFGIEVKDRSELFSFIGPPLIGSFERFYGFSKGQAIEAVKYYREYYSEYGIFENELYDGILSLFERLKNDNKVISIATSKPEFFAKQIADHYGFSKYFDLIAGASMDETRTEKSEVISYALDLLGIKDTSRVLMIGDRYYDVIGASEFDIPTVGVLYGYGSKEELEKAGAYILAETPLDIYDKIFRKYF